jgi:hypothetical protein
MRAFVVALCGQLTVNERCRRKRSAAAGKVVRRARCVCVRAKHLNALGSSSLAVSWYVEGIWDMRLRLG